MMDKIETLYDELGSVQYRIAYGCYNSQSEYDELWTKQNELRSEIFEQAEKLGKSVADLDERFSWALY